MNTEERVITALKKGQADRVPVFIYLNPYKENAWYCKDPSYGELLEATAQYADILHDVHFPWGFLHNAVALEEEFKDLGNGVTEHTIHTPKGPLVEHTRADWRGEGTIKKWICEPRDVERLLSLPHVSPRPDWKPLLAERERLKGRATMQMTFPDPICSAGLIDDNSLAIWTVEERPLLKQLFDVAYERVYEELRYCLEGGVGPLYYFNGPEYALPPLMSPADFEEFVVAYDQKLVDLIHSYPGNYAVIHSHGKVSNFLEQFARIGMDCLNVLEPPPMGDTILSDAKKRIGKKVCLIGNIQYDDLARGSPTQIEHLVRDAISQGAPGGGFILSPCASPYERPIPKQASDNFIHYLKMGRKYGELAYA